MNTAKARLEDMKHAIQNMELNQDFHEQYFISKFMKENNLRYDQVELCRKNSWEDGVLVQRFWCRKSEGVIA